MPTSRRKTPQPQPATLVRVLVIEDDPYARDVMALLLTRDWRTELAGEVSRSQDLPAMLADPNTGHVDVVLLDAERPDDPDWPIRQALAIRAVRGAGPAIVLTATRPEVGLLQHILTGQFRGYLLKSEIGYGLTWAVVRAAAGRWVTTPGVRDLSQHHKWHLPLSTLILLGGRLLGELSSREQEVARLGIVFGLTRSDIANDLRLRPDEIGKLMSRIYRKLGLSDSTQGRTELKAYLMDPWLRDSIAGGAVRSSRAGKRANKATKAFHLLTVPDEFEL